jgi:Zn-dependent protease
VDGWTLRVGSVRGIPIRAHATFLLVLPLLAYAFARQFTAAARAADVPPDQLGGSPWLWGLGVALALFLSVLVHELAHSLYALRRGGRVRGITLLLIGGVSEIAELPRTGRDEAVMALVGPVTSLVLGGAFWVLSRAVASAAMFDWRFALFQLTYLNVALGLFNLLPAFPMDGGRILRGLLADRKGLLRATRIASETGKAFAVAFGLLGLAAGNVLLVAIAFFVYLGAEAENRSVLVKALLGHIRVRDLVTAPAEPIAPSVSVFAAGERMLRERKVGLPVAEGARVLGVVGLEDVQRVPPEERAAVPVASVVRPVPPVRADDPASRVLGLLAEARGALVPVVDGGAVVALLSDADVGRALRLSRLEASQHPGEAGLGPPHEAQASHRG